MLVYILLLTDMSDGIFEFYQELAVETIEGRSVLAVFLAKHMSITMQNTENVSLLKQRGFGGTPTALLNPFFVQQHVYDTTAHQYTIPPQL